MNDRALMLEWQQGQKTEAEAVDQVGHAIALAASTAAFCATLYDALLVPQQTGYLSRFTHEEALRIVCAAVQGR
jgi:hypothetical protein